MTLRRCRVRSGTVAVMAAHVLLAACGSNSAAVAAAGVPHADPADPATPVAAAPAAGSVIHLKRFDILDKTGFARPVPVASLLAPADWRLEGGIVWTPQWRCMIDMVRADARLVSPDGRVVFQVFPAYTGEWQDDAHGRELHAQLMASGALVCPLQAPFSAEQFLTGVLVPGFRQGARVVERKPAPEVAKAALAEYGPIVAASRLNKRFEADAARVRIRYADSEEWLFATVGVVTMPALSPSAAMQGNLNVWQNTYTTTADRIYGFRAPAGELDQYEPLVAAMIGSIRLNPEWQAALTQVQINIARIIQKGVADRAGIIREGQREIADMQMKGWQAARASQDRVMASWSQAMRGTATYVDSSAGAPVELPDHYDSVWSDGLGEYALVTTPGVNPNQVLSGSWTELRKQR